jgi:hypothetical protein
MTGKAVQSKVIQRVLLIALLLAVAHAIKPFSLRNVTFHLVHSAPSFAFALPGSMRGDVSSANHLASALERGWRLYETRREPTVEADWPVDENNVVAQAAPQAENRAVCETQTRRSTRRAVTTARANESRQAAPEQQAAQQAVRTSRESVKGLVASNAMKVESEWQAVQLPDLGSLKPLVISLPVQLPSRCESRELKQAAVSREVRAVADMERAREHRVEDREVKVVKAAARQKLTQGFKVLMANAAIKRVAVNCSTTFNTQSGLQINFRCS